MYTYTYYILIIFESHQLSYEQQRTKKWITMNKKNYITKHIIKVSASELTWKKINWLYIELY